MFFFSFDIIAKINSEEWHSLEWLIDDAVQANLTSDKIEVDTEARSEMR